MMLIEVIHPQTLEEFKTNLVLLLKKFHRIVTWNPKMTEARDLENGNTKT